MPAALAVVMFVASDGRAMDRHMNWHRRYLKGKKMSMSAATYFGAAGIEEFVGVATTSDGKVAAIGNSWGPPFPEKVKPAVLGADQLWDGPLVGHDRFRLVSDSQVRLARFMPNGHVVIYAWSDGGNTEFRGRVFGGLQDCALVQRDRQLYAPGADGRGPGRARGGVAVHGGE